MDKGETQSFYSFHKKKFMLLLKVVEFVYTDKGKEEKMGKREQTDKRTYKFVWNITFFIDIVFLICHTGFVFTFKKMGIDIMYYFNCFSVVLYFLLFFYLQKRVANAEDKSVIIGDTIFNVAIYGELFAHLVIATICLGLGVGFTQYFYGIIPACMFTDYFIGKRRTMRKQTVAIIVVFFATYVSLLLWGYMHQPVYEVSVQMKQHFFLFNSIMTMCMIIFYTYSYINVAFSQERHLRMMADFDVLTGIRNRRAMMKVIDSSYKECKSKGKTMAICIADIDHFKKINDTYGHDAGDAVLSELGTILSERENNELEKACARWGGEEFVILYEIEPEHKDLVVKKLEELRSYVARQTVCFKDLEIGFTMTFGVAFGPENHSVKSMLALADRRLYEGKKSSRNCVVSQGFEE